MPVSRRKMLTQLVATALAGASARSLAAYSLPTDTRELEHGPIRLNRNENAYGPSEKAVSAAASSFAFANRYPSRQVEDLKEAIAGIHGVGAEQVVVGPGSSELLRTLAAAFLGPNKRLITAAPTFDVIAKEARWAGADVVEVPLTRDYAHNLGEMLSHAQKSAGLIYVCNPNNPTGSLTGRDDLESFLRAVPREYYVVIDEAYHHYVPPSVAYRSFIDHPTDNPRVIVTRTFSKVYGLAGARIGYAVAAPQTTRRLATERLEASLSSFGLTAAIAALTDLDHVSNCARRNTDDVQEFLNQVNARHGHVIDPHANFVLIQTDHSAETVLEQFAQKDILLGPAVPEMNTHVRVSLGTAAEMEEFWRVWDVLLPISSMHMNM